MPGNEKAVCKYIFENLGELSLNHLGTITKMENADSERTLIDTLKKVDEIRPDSSSKKADIFLNEIGVSIKQSPSCNLFNRLQRAELEELLTRLGISDVKSKIKLLDAEVHWLHNGGRGRNRPWNNIFSEQEFKILLKYLMMTGSPNLGDSDQPASLILEAPRYITSKNEIEVYTFDEFFDKFKDKIKIAIRRCWYGQSSNSEHGRAEGLISKPGNSAWVFNTISGRPNGWRDSIKPEERKTVYYCMIEKVR